MDEYRREVVLPSKGRLYGDLLPDGRVIVTPFSTKEEKLLATSGGKSAEQLLDYFIRGCVLTASGEKWPSNIPPNKMLIVDRLYLLMMIRSVSYGRLYYYEFRCEDCGKRSQGQFDIWDRPVEAIPDDFEEPFEVDLPMSGHTLGLRLYRGVDEVAIGKFLKQRNRQVRKAGGAGNEDDDYQYRLARHIVTIDENEVDLNAALTLVEEELRAPDTLEMKNALDDAAFGMDISVEPDCTHCNYPNGPMEVPMTGEFFRPRRRRSSSGADPRGAAVSDDSWQIQLPGRSESASAGEKVVGSKNTGRHQRTSSKPTTGHAPRKVKTKPIPKTTGSGSGVTFDVAER